MANFLDFVVKTVERCNLNCSYCYFFNGLDKSFKNKPKFISKSVIDDLASFIRNAINNPEFDIREVSVVLHGGEPLMQPKGDFVYMI